MSLIRSSEFNIIMKDEQESHVYKWEPEEDIKVLGVLVHGSCKHAKRYIDFAQFLTDKGYVVYANDLRGHGLSVKSNDDLGYFAEKSEISNAEISRIESWKRKEPSPTVLKAFVPYLGVSYEKFLKEAGYL